MRYNWQLSDWPEFTWDAAQLDLLMLAFAEETGIVTEAINTMPESMRIDTIVATMVAEAIKTSEIEGEYLSQQDVMSSIRNNLGLNSVPEAVKYRKARGVGELMVDVRDTWAEALTAEKLFAWHVMLMSGNSRVNAGLWRFHDAPMQIVSGALGHEVVHFEAPPSAAVPAEMERFIIWFNETGPGGPREMKSAPLRSAIAHLYFESIHPFEDGNGRIGRAIAEKALSQGIGRPVMLSLSMAIEANRKEYYQALQQGSQSNHITAWLIYFINTILESQSQARQRISATLHKARFLDRHKDDLQERQLKVIKKMLDAGAGGFEGGMTAKKYMSITRTSKATATRDLQTLVDKGVLLPAGGGRSLHYILQDF